MPTNVAISQETKSLIRPFQSTFYPTKIPHQHYQLKNYISTTDPDIIYYSSEHEIYALHLSSQKRELIAILPWRPCCLDAGYGWVCVGGGNKGRCAFIRLNEVGPGPDNDRASHHHVEVDALLPLDLDPESRVLAHSFLDRTQRPPSSPGRRKPEIQFQQLGDLIINSVSVHCFRSDRKGLGDEVVAVATNNDKSVRIFSLAQSRVLATLQFPTPMNHASISPDGQLMVAVGDEPQAFFVRRIRLPSLAFDGESAFARYEWHLIAEPRLSLAPEKDACFSTAFSPSGHICAVASQTGIVTIFDTSLIDDDMDADDAVIEVLKSSRPSLRDYCGAIRSMRFAPAPWDLLAWAEDQGRVCVVDLRNAFRSRQTLELDTESPSLNRIILSDLDDSLSEQDALEVEASFLQRHREALDANDHLAAVSHAADYMEIAAERRRLQREALDVGFLVDHDLTNELTESERQMLDSIRTSRLRESGQSRAETPPHPLFSVNYLPSASNIPPVRQTPQVSLPPSSNPSTLAQSFRASENRGTDSIREYMRQRNIERHRTGDRSYQPRRRSSVIISNSNPSNHSSSAHPSNLAPIGTGSPTISASPSRIASAAHTASQPSGSSDPWQTISEAMDPSMAILDAANHLPQIRRERDAAATRTLERHMQQQQQQQIEAAQQQQAAHLNRVRSANSQRLRHLHGRAVTRVPTEESAYDDHELDMRRPGGRDEGVGTVGIGWGVDGRNLYVGTEDGIFEFAVNLDERKQFPGVAFR